MSSLLEKTAPPNLAQPTLLLPEELASFWDDMIRFARLHLREESLAEDAVQDSMAAALEGLGKFKKRAQFKTWVFAILKNKIIDIMRDRRRLDNITTAIDEIPDEAIDDLFDEEGCWNADARPSNWGNPEQCLSSQQFWRVFELCLNRLPENTGRIFMMREMLGFETDEICEELHISSSNCWVVLHRARMTLRICLNERWFLTERKWS